MRSGSAGLRTKAAGLAVVVSLAACGTQVPHSQIVAANGPVVAGSVAAADNGGAGTPSAVGAGSPGGSSNPSTGGGPVSPTAAGGGSKTSGTAVASPNAPSSPSGGPATPGAANGAPIVVGNIGSYSGVLGSIFVGGPAGVLAWAQSVNQRGGINGHPVKVVSGDDKGDPSIALSLAKAMVESDGAIGLVGTMVPLSLSGIRSYIEQKGIPLVGGDVTLPDWIKSPVIFPQGTDVTSIASGAVRLITAGNYKKLAVLYCGESPSCKGLADGASASPPPGVQTVYTAQISIVQTDFTTECLQAKNAGAQAIFVAADANTVIRVGRSCAQQQYKPRYGTASIAVGPQLASDPNMDGLVAPVNNAPWFLASTPGTKEFADAMRTFEAGAPLAATAMSMFASGKLVEAAGAHFGAHPTAADLLAGLDALRGTTLDGLAPPLSFSAGRGSGPIPCYFVVQVSGGQWTAPSGATPQCS